MEFNKTYKQNIENIKKIGALFPSCMTEAIIDGVVTIAVDFDALKEELSHFLIEDRDQRYQFNWAGKKKSVMLANYPINKTLRPVRVNEIVAQGENESRKAYFRSGSVNFDNTRNLYIEGADIEVLKLLQETYLSKIKMIYIGAPSEDEGFFTLEDDFLESEEETKEASEKENHYQNYSTFFHTNWLNKLYPVLKIAKDLLKDDGVILISVEDKRIHILRKICDEIFGANNFYGQIVYASNTVLPSTTIEKGVKYLLCYSREIMPLLLTYENTVRKEVFSLANSNNDSGKNIEFTNKDDEHIVYYYERTGNGQSGNHNKLIERTSLGYTVYYFEGLDNEEDVNFSKQIEIANSYGFKTFNILNNKFVSAIAVFDYDINKITDNAKEENVYSDVKALIELGYKKIRPPKRKGGHLGCWTWSIGTFKQYWNNDEVLIKNYSGIIKKELVNITDIITLDNKRYIEKVNVLPIKNLFDKNQNTSEREESLNDDLISRERTRNFTEGEILKIIITALNDRNMLVLEAFNSSESVVGESILELNSKDGGGRNFIIVKDPEENIKGAKNSCEAGKERIKRVGNKIISQGIKKNIELDIGFRVLKLDTSNIDEVYLAADSTTQDRLDMLTDNIKSDRTPEDLLFEVMLDIGIDLSSEIKVSYTEAKVFHVGGDNLIACFDSEITKDVVAEIANKKPKYAVFSDSSFKRDDIKVSFDQIFETYSKTTKRIVI